ncbi:G5 domain-containing protein [Staphylococcus aureus]
MWTCKRRLDCRKRRDSIEKERKFNPDLAPGTEKVTREGQEGTREDNNDANAEKSINWRNY